VKIKSPSLARWLLPLVLALATRGVCGAGGDDAPSASLRPVSGFTGTQHYSKAVELRFGHDAPAVFTTNNEKGELAPEVIVLVRQIAPGSAVALGVSSQGSGMATLQAILFERVPGGGTRITDRLEMNVQRGYGGMVWAGGRLYFIHPLHSVVFPGNKEHEDAIAREYQEYDQDGDSEPFISTLHGQVKYAAMARVKFAKQVSAGALFMGDGVLAGNEPQGEKQIASMEMAGIPIAKGRFDLSAFKKK
jgi:hypothetical protein